MHTRLLRLRTLLAVGVLLSACGAPTTGSRAPTTPTLTASATAALGDVADPHAIPIGIAVAQTSDLAIYGLDMLKGARVAEAFVNARGGVNGRPIRLIAVDSGGDDASAQAAFQTLIDQDVVAIIGPDTSAQAFAAHPLANAAEVLALGPSTTAPGVPEIGPYSARVAAPDTEVAPYAVTAALTINPQIRSVVALYAADDPFSVGETAVFQRAITQTYGLELAAVQPFSTTDTEVQQHAQAALTHTPDLIMISGLANSAALVTALRKADYTGLIIGGDGLNTAEIFTHCGGACNDLILAQRYSLTAPHPMNRAFVTAYQAAQQADPSQNPALMFSAVQVVVEALTALDRQTPIAALNLPALRAALNTQVLAGVYDTPLGRLTFTPDGEIRQERVYAVRAAIDADGTDGQFTPLTLDTARR
jgi:branched-chain amino acid transport system substrate-binding protein